ncbi:hypothetical protein AAFF_G00247700 [Aldrovandia affinis]|uniref:Gamma-glutamylcyclotransferase n=1 Tax=Aldrovandia affinis TaxID=143900 RepID=A0AAD7RDB4_9TELE|nr:hypothetical protein AAFF_G00247700 [Aldrovandia affinis]
MKPQDILAEKTSLWIFGYGSLVWKPDFKFKRSKVGYIQGYKRRFWHGDNFHRGNNEMPGRVVTLVEDDDACTWGVAYEVTGSQVEESLKYLNVREAVLGGYVTRAVEFTARGAAMTPLMTSPRCWRCAEEIAMQIAVSHGKTGHNIEYLLRLADFMRRHCPGVEDAHLFSIEAATLALVPYLLASAPAL